MKEAAVKPREVLEDNTGFTRGVYRLLALPKNSKIEQLVLDAFSFPGTECISTNYEIVTLIQQRGLVRKDIHTHPSFRSRTMPLVTRLTFRIVVEAGNLHYWRDNLAPKASRTQKSSLQDVSRVTN